MNYRIGFWSLVGVVLVGSLLAMAVLISYEKRPMDILSRMLQPNVSVEDHYAWLPNHYTEEMDVAPHSYTKNVTTLDDFYEWRDRQDGVLAQFQDRPNVHDITEQPAELLESRSEAGYTLNKFAMKAFFDAETIIFYELLPERDIAQYNAVLVVPGSGHQGALDVLGEPGPWQAHYYHDRIAKILGAEGYAVYVVELRGYGQRAIDVGSACNTSKNPTTCSSAAVEGKMRAFGIDMSDLRTDEITQVLAYIKARPYIDRIAVAGLSAGAGLAADQAIINRSVVDAIVLASGIGTTLYSPINMQQLVLHNQAACCDTMDQIATIAPTPAYISFGKQESTSFRWHAESGFVEESLGEAYRLHGKPENLYHYVHEGGHGYHIPTVLDFLNTHIGTEAGR